MAIIFDRMNPTIVNDEEHRHPQDVDSIQQSVMCMINPVNKALFNLNQQEVKRSRSSQILQAVQKNTTARVDSKTVPTYLEINNLKNKLKERENEANLAAEIGKMLLQKNLELKSMARSSLQDQKCNTYYKHRDLELKCQEFSRNYNTTLHLLPSMSLHSRTKDLFCQDPTPISINQSHGCYQDSFDEQWLQVEDCLDKALVLLSQTQLLHDQIKDLEKSKETTEQEANVRETELCKLYEQYNKKCDEQSASQDRLWDLELHIQKLQAKMDSIQEKNTLLAKENDTLNKRVSSSFQAIEEFKARESQLNHALTEQVKKYHKDTKKLNENIENLQKSLVWLENEIENPSFSDECLVQSNFTVSSYSSSSTNNSRKENFQLHIDDRNSIWQNKDVNATTHSPPSFLPNSTEPSKSPLNRAESSFNGFRNISPSINMLSPATSTPNQFLESDYKGLEMPSIASFQSTPDETVFSKLTGVSNQNFSSDPQYTILCNLSSNVDIESTTEDNRLDGSTFLSFRNSNQSLKKDDLRTCDSLMNLSSDDDEDNESYQSSVYSGNCFLRRKKAQEKLKCLTVSPQIYHKRQTSVSCCTFGAISVSSDELANSNLNNDNRWNSHHSLPSNKDIENLPFSSLSKVKSKFSGLGVLILDGDRSSNVNIPKAKAKLASLSTYFFENNLRKIKLRNRAFSCDVSPLSRNIYKNHRILKRGNSTGVYSIRKLKTENRNSNGNLNWEVGASKIGISHMIGSDFLEAKDDFDTELPTNCITASCPSSQPSLLKRRKANIKLIHKREFSEWNSALLSPESNSDVIHFFPCLGSEKSRHSQFIETNTGSCPHNVLRSNGHGAYSFSSSCLPKDQRNHNIQDNMQKHTSLYASHHTLEATACASCQVDDFPNIKFPQLNRNDILDESYQNIFKLASPIYSDFSLAIQTVMLGEFMWMSKKGVRNQEKRRLKFFWVNPVQKTLYWSNQNPGTQRSLSVSQTSKYGVKSTHIESIKVINDNMQDNILAVDKQELNCACQFHWDNLPIFSLIIHSCDNKDIKIKARTQARHSIWLTALSYLQNSVPTIIKSNHKFCGISRSDLPSFGKRY